MKNTLTFWSGDSGGAPCFRRAHKGRDAALRRPPPGPGHSFEQHKVLAFAALIRGAMSLPPDRTAFKVSQGHSRLLNATQAYSRVLKKVFFLFYGMRVENSPRRRESPKPVQGCPRLSKPVQGPSPGRGGGGWGCFEPQPCLGKFRLV